MAEPTSDRTDVLRLAEMAVFLSLVGLVSQLCLGDGVFGFWLGLLAPLGVFLGISAHGRAKRVGAPTTWALAAAIVGAVGTVFFGIKLAFLSAVTSIVINAALASPTPTPAPVLASAAKVQSMYADINRRLTPHSVEVKRIQLDFRRLLDAVEAQKVYQSELQSIDIAIQVAASDQLVSDDEVSPILGRIEAIVDRVMPLPSPVPTLRKKHR